MVQARQLQRQPVPRGQRLGLVERGEAFGDAVVEAHPGGAGDQRRARSPAGGRRLERRPAGFDRLPAAAELEQQAAARHEQREAVSCVGGEGEPALDRGASAAAWRNCAASALPAAR